MGNSWTGDVGDSDESEEENPETETGDSTEGSQPSLESFDDQHDESHTEEKENDSRDSQGHSEETGGSPQTESDGPPQFENALTPDEAMNEEQRWKIMTWGPPKLFKTHFGLTMPEPIAIVDTEEKVPQLSKKFADTEYQVWRPSDMDAEPDTPFRRAKKCLDEALEWLEWYYENEGRRGTIMVDSMSDMWEFAQRHHKLENYPMKDPDEIELSSNFGSSQESDWAVVKEYHNGEFRDRIVNSPFHVYWTAMQRVDYEETVGDDKNRRFLEPVGEPKNEYKVDVVLRARKDSDDGKVGDMVGSNMTDNVFVGLHKPTFPKVKSAIERVQGVEASEESVSRAKLAEELGVQAVIDHDPQVYLHEKGDS